MDNHDGLSQQLKALEDPIADDGFTDHVMAKIENQFNQTPAPKRNSQLSREAWVIVLALLVGLAIALFNFPIIALSTWLIEQNAELLQLSKWLASSIGLVLISGWLLTAAGCGWSLMQLR